MFVPRKIFRPSPMFVGEDRSLPKALAFPANIRLGWKGLPGTNTLAYYEKPQISALISFKGQAPGHPGYSYGHTLYLPR